METIVLFYSNKCDPAHIPASMFLLVYEIVRAKMHIPIVGQQVYVDEVSGVFVVAWVDDETQTVDLVPSTGSAPREEYVPWQKLFCCSPSPNERVN